MDAAMLEVILLNLLSQALWEFAVSPLVGRSETFLAPVRGAAPGWMSEVALRASERIDSLGIDSTGVDIEQVLMAPEVRTLIRELYVFGIGTQPDGVAVARRTFSAYWLEACPSAAGAADGVFDALADAADQALGSAVREGNLAALDTRSALRQRLIVDHLHAIERRLASLTRDELSLSEVNAFETQYRAEVAARCAYITPPDFHGASRVPLDDLYVLPRLERTAPREETDDAFMQFEQWLQSLDRCVVLGNPGAGKSTLSRKLAFDLASTPSRATVAGRSLTPAIVVLKDYGVEKREHGLSVRDFLEGGARASYQLDPPSGAFEYLLGSGRMAVLFDGLDELLDTSYRQEIRADVESFCRQYPNTAVLVTSRHVGYDQAPLAPDMFDLVRVAEFNDDQVNEYANKWFCLDDELSPQEQEEKAAAFVAESSVVPDLRSNALLLALMCNLFRGQSYIPRNRPDVYEKCAQMLFEVWDKSRGIEAVLPIAEHLRPAMQDLARWIYSNDSLRSGVTRDQLIERSTEFLQRWRFDDIHTARHAAGEFVDFCRGRAWVFSDLGSTATGEDLFQFTHQTFLEYFAAADLVSTCETTNELASILVPRVALAEWDVVAQLAVQLKSRSHLGAADELLETFLKANGAAAARYNTTHFAVRALAFLVPTPGCTRTLLETSTDEMVKLTAEISEIEPDRSPTWPGNLVQALRGANPEVAEVAYGAMRRRLEELLSGDEQEAAAAARLLIHIWTTSGIDFDGPDDDALASLVRGRIERLRRLATANALLATDLALASLIEVSNLLEWHGMPVLFLPRPALATEGAGWFGPLAQDLWRSALGRGGLADGLDAVGRFARQSPPPWEIVQPEYFVLRPFGFPPRGEEAGARLSEYEALGLFLLTAISLELMEPDAFQSHGVEELRHYADLYWPAVGEALVAREDSSGSGIDDLALLSLVPDESRALVASWVSRELDLVARSD